VSELIKQHIQLIRGWYIGISPQVVEPLGQRLQQLIRMLDDQLLSRECLTDVLIKYACARLQSYFGMILCLVGLSEFICVEVLRLDIEGHK
jgi:hypothetical protein